MKKYFLSPLVVLCLTHTYLFANEKITLLYDKDWNLTDAINYAYKREVSFDFAQLIFDGEYEDYDKEDNLIGEGTYVKGVKTGIHKTYFSNKKLRSSIGYTANDFDIRELNSETESMIKEGSGEFSILVSYGKKEGLLKGEYKNHKKTGTWVLLVDGKKIFEENFKDNEFKNGTQFLERGGEFPLIKEMRFHIKPDEVIESFDFSKLNAKNLNSYFLKIRNGTIDSISTGVRYLGGINNLISEIGNSIRYPFQARTNKIQGKVLVGITIDSVGSVKKYEVVKCADSSLDDEAIRVLKLYEYKWFPALAKGEPYESIITIPVTFNLGKTIYSK